MSIRIEVRGGRQAHSRQIVRNAHALGILEVETCQIQSLYYLSHHPGTEPLHRLCALLLADPVVEEATWVDLTQTGPPDASDGVQLVEVAPRAGVTNITARELERGMAEMGLPGIQAATASRYEFTGPISSADLHRLARELLCNDTVEQYSLIPIHPHFDQDAQASNRVDHLSLDSLDEAALLQLSRERLLSLDKAEMSAIQAEFARVGRPPTDVELETLAQTWSEHCVHKTFRATIDFTWLDAQGEVLAQSTINGLLRDYIRAATEAIQPPWLRSAFVDDAGIIAFDDDYDLAFKVETHNHPSALEPFGGANTGIGGVVRDIIGVSARPIATTDVLCFGPQDYPLEKLPPGILHPQRIAAGVVAGVGDYGNKLGLPTVNGAILYDEGYLGNPLVFCGCVGLLPRNSHPTQAQIGDLVVVLGGRTGRDGLHGATFSSAELTHETSETTGSAVQIGDPITEKGLIELVEAARDHQLYTAITDCGAGGLSSAVGEMGAQLGVDVELTQVALKYPGLAPWEIWLSEAQERMVLAVPPANLARLQELAARWEVEVSVLGSFTGEGRLVVRYDQAITADLEMEFLHDGLPRRRMQAVYQELPGGESDLNGPAPHPQSAIANLPSLLLALLAHPNVASKEKVIRTYDHEVRGGTLVRPLIGPKMDGPADGAVLKPLGTWGHNQAFALANGINPLLGRRDPYAMAVSAIDEAVRNLTAVGADPDRIAILDNFCWGNPTLPDRLGALVRTCQGCYDGAVAYGTPFISGKDSLYNEFNGNPIPGTLLISAIGIVPNMERCVTSDLKQAGNRLYLLGETRAEMGGSLLYHHLGLAGGVPPQMPSSPLERYRRLHQAMQLGLVRSCHDLSEGGLGVALAEMCLAGRLGAEINLEPLHPDAEVALFSESNGRLLLEVNEADAPDLESLFADLPLIPIGAVARGTSLVITADQTQIINLQIDDLLYAFKGGIS